MEFVVITAAKNNHIFIYRILISEKKKIYKPSLTNIVISPTSI
jgi:hypothetical protein